MRTPPTPAAMIAALAASLTLGLGGCSWMHHGKNSGCRDPNLIGDAKNLPALKVPPGLDAPDTRNAIKVPPLTEPERPRARTEPCLSMPPNYKG